MTIERDTSVVLFDGTCAMCNRAVNLIVQLEAAPNLRFASNKSNFAKSTWQSRAISTDVNDSIILVEPSGVAVKSDAVLKIATHLRRPYSWLAHFRLVPRFVRDAVYTIVANNRHRIFGKVESCGMLANSTRSRILE